MRDILVISGGGQKGIGYLGILKKLEEKGIKDFTILSGSSIGGIICAGFVLGYSIDEIKEIFLTLTFNDIFCVKDTKILTLLSSTFSISDGTKIDSVIRSYISNKKYNPDTLTFKELYEKTNKYLILTGSNITKNRVDYFSHIKTPDMKVFTALQITSRMPFFYPYVRYNNYDYVDGFLYDPFPVKGIDSKLFSKDRLVGIIDVEDDNVLNNNIIEYLHNIFYGVVQHYTLKLIKKYKNNVYILRTDITNTLTCNKEELETLYKKGYDTVK
jgi:predicted acylesterase/phospholipase RssA